ncbi:hypothetical protein L6472_04755 [Prevotella sp. E13-17]|uniref:hypothetical protein n=1 Tax=Prevotella sp. E13-17 TaxID=2913616 RepID=UPI001EDBD40A|nr:hypothetical protein [Prevotella sp. E13-17]UKK51897.1 hypothetical protein L6472_04755 [Prevotella sp. E13-17]
MKKVILLTGCINPNGMAFTQLNNVSERQKQYINAIHFYLSNTNCPIVFCENSDTDIQPFIENAQDRLEILTFSGNKNKQRGKGYGEAEIIEYALSHSSFIQEDCIIIKITGRLIVNNICPIIKSLTCKQDFVTCLFHSDLTFADSRIFCATVSFFCEFLNNKERINDSENVFFEHILSSTVLASSIRFIPYIEEPLITGISGSTGKQYCALSTDDRKKYLFKRYAWTQAKSIYVLSKNKRQGVLERISLSLKVFKYTLLSKLI